MEYTTRAQKLKFIYSSFKRKKLSVLRKNNKKVIYDDSIFDVMTPSHTFHHIITI